MTAGLAIIILTLACFFFKNSPSQNWTKLYWLDAHMIEVLIGESYNPFQLPRKEIEPTGQ